MTDPGIYLASSQATEHVSALLARYASTTWPRGCTLSAEAGVWTLDQHKAWMRVRFGEEETTVYYRQDAERFVVIDAGGAIQALRLATGCLATEAREWAERRVLHGMNGDAWLSGPDEVWLDMVAGHIHAETRDRRRISARDLPKAIRTLMLAAWRVSQLEVYRG